MKLKKRIAAVAAAMVMAASTMAISASADTADTTVGYSETHTHLKVSLYTLTTTLNNCASTTATNMAGSGKLMVCSATVFVRTGNSISPSKDTNLAQKTVQGSGTNVATGQATVAQNSKQVRYGRGVVQMYNSGVTMSGTCCDASTTCYFT